MSLVAYTEWVEKYRFSHKTDEVDDVAYDAFAAGIKVGEMRGCDYFEPPNYCDLMARDIKRNKDK